MWLPGPDGQPVTGAALRSGRVPPTRSRARLHRPPRGDRRTAPRRRTPGRDGRGVVARVGAVRPGSGRRRLLAARAGKWVTVEVAARRKPRTGQAGPNGPRRDGGRRRGDDPKPDYPATINCPLPEGQNCTRERAGRNFRIGPNVEGGMMRRLLALVPMVFLVACTLAPTPGPTLAPSPSPTVSAAPSVSSSPSAVSLSIVCGPLGSAPGDCAGAVEAATRLKDADVAWSSIRVDLPDKTCAGSTGQCRPATIVVRFFASGQSAPVAEVPLIRATTGWISLSSIR
jgi:hypothetical protein